MMERLFHPKLSWSKGVYPRGATSPHTCGLGAQTALVDKDDDAALAAGVFL